VSTYQTDEEQVEALKKWWKEHGKSIIAGAVVGLSLVLGWQGWERYDRGQAEQAAGYYSEFSNTVRSGQAAQAAEQGDRLIKQFGDSAYASFAALELARLAYDEGRFDQARERLQWVADHSVDAALAQLGRLRLGQLLLDQGELDAARGVVDAADKGSYVASFAELRGDIAVAAGDNAAAAAAYQEALAADAENADLVRMKLADTGHAPAL